MALYMGDFWACFFVLDFDMSLSLYCDSYSYEIKTTINSYLLPRFAEMGKILHYKKVSFQFFLLKYFL